MAPVEVHSPFLAQQTEFSEDVAFPSFAKLPPEIRLMVWELCLPGPRLIKIHYHYHYRSDIQRFYTSTPAPSLLHICHESRSVALPSYKLHFGTLSNPAIVWANLRIDTVSMDWDPLRKIAAPHEDMEKIQRLEVTGQDVLYTNSFRVMGGIMLFHSLLDVTFCTIPIPGNLLSENHKNSVMDFVDVLAKKVFELVRWMSLLYHNETRKKPDLFFQVVGTSGARLPRQPIVLWNKKREVEDSEVEGEYADDGGGFLSGSLSREEVASLLELYLRMDRPGGF